MAKSSVSILVLATPPQPQASFDLNSSSPSLLSRPFRKRPHINFSPTTFSVDHKDLFSPVEAGKSSANQNLPFPMEIHITLVTDGKPAPTSLASNALIPGGKKTALPAQRLSFSDSCFSPLLAPSPRRTNCLALTDSNFHCLPLSSWGLKVHCRKNFHALRKP